MTDLDMNQSQCLNNVDRYPSCSAGFFVYSARERLGDFAVYMYTTTSNRCLSR